MDAQSPLPLRWPIRESRRLSSINATTSVENVTLYPSVISGRVDGYPSVGPGFESYTLLFFTLFFGENFTEAMEGRPYLRKVVQIYGRWVPYTESGLGSYGRKAPMLWKEVWLWKGYGSDFEL